MNIFLCDYYTRLHAWHQLRNSIHQVDTKTICIEVDKFWQQCPLVNHYLHPADVVDWPTPWELINDNNYCMYARGLGMVYTLMLLGIENIDFVDAIDDNNENVCLVLVDNAKYVLNYHPNQVVNMKLSDFTDIRYLDLTALHKKIGKE
jgi:hypothetical protein